MAIKIDRIVSPQQDTNPDKSIEGLIHAALPKTTSSEPTRPTTKTAYNIAVKKIPTSQPTPQKQTLSPPQNPKTSYHPSRLVLESQVRSGLVNGPSGCLTGP